MNSFALETAPAPMSAWKRFWLSAAMVSLALYETWDSYMFFTNLGLSEITRSGFGGYLMKTFVVTQPFFAPAALLCALTGRVRWAVIALAGVVLGRWLWFLPGPNGSLDSKDLYALQPTIKLLIIPPLLAVCALVLAKRKERLGLATLLVAVPSVYSNFEMALFAIAVTIYGF